MTSTRLGATHSVSEKFAVSDAAVRQRYGKKERRLKRFRVVAPLSLLAIGVLLFNPDYTSQIIPGWARKRPIVCQPPSPNLLRFYPPSARDVNFVKPLKKLDEYLTHLVSNPGVDSVSVSVVTARGPVFERGYGVLRANETDESKRYPPDRDSIYRIASVSKMFTVLETLILRERGVLNWDDPVEKYIPDFAPPDPSYGWASYHGTLEGEAPSSKNNRPRITLRQLATHLSGLGRDYPTDIGKWPPKGLVNFPRKFIPTTEEMLEFVAKYPLINSPYSYPIYSNVGFGVLGLVNVAANNLSSSSEENIPRSHKELLKRDVFEPLGLNSSFFTRATSPLRERVAVAAVNSEWADIEFGDAYDGVGGQWSSLADLGTVMKSFLAPLGRNSGGGLLSPNTMQEWLHPLFVWENSPQQVGAPWEIATHGGVQAYAKSGNLPGHRSQFALIPSHSYGVVVLVTGAEGDTIAILSDVVSIVQPAFKTIQTQILRSQFEGKWINGDDVAEVTVKDESIWLKKLVIGGSDVLAEFQHLKKAKPVAFWSTGRVGEFRLAIGPPGLGKDPTTGCFPYWATIDPGVHARDSPVDLVYWKRGALVYPAAGVQLNRAKRSD